MHSFTIFFGLCVKRPNSGNKVALNPELFVKKEEMQQIAITIRVQGQPENNPTAYLLFWAATSDNKETVVSNVLKSLVVENVAPSSYEIQGTLPSLTIAFKLPQLPRFKKEILEFKGVILNRQMVKLTEFSLFSDTKGEFYLPIQEFKAVLLQPYLHAASSWNSIKEPVGYRKFNVSAGENGLTLIENNSLLGTVLVSLQASEKLLVFKPDSDDVEDLLTFVKTKVSIVLQEKELEYTLGPFSWNLLKESDRKVSAVVKLILESLHIKPTNTGQRDINPDEFQLTYNKKEAFDNEEEIGREWRRVFAAGSEEEPHLVISCKFKDRYTYVLRCIYNENAYEIDNATVSDAVGKKMGLGSFVANVVGEKKLIGKILKLDVYYSPPKIAFVSQMTDAREHYDGADLKNWWEGRLKRATVYMELRAITLLSSTTASSGADAATTPPTVKSVSVLSYPEKLALLVERGFLTRRQLLRMLIHS
jgi:hypothetical protein